jgi:thiol-disulfide isomerase/thioredoxin
MRKAIISAVLAALMVSTVFAADKPGYPKSVEKKLYADDVRGKKAPEFSVAKWITDEPDRKGKVVLIDFWATWCPPCREAIKELNKFSDQFKDESAETIKTFMAANKISYPLAIDPDKKMSKAINVAGIPHVLIISTDGVVRWQGFPLSNEEPLSADIVKQVIDADPGIAERKAKNTK